jgi:hypothetical protein
MLSLLVWAAVRHVRAPGAGDAYGCESLDSGDAHGPRLRNLAARASPSLVWLRRRLQLQNVQATRDWRDEAAGAVQWMRTPAHRPN